MIDGAKPKAKINKVYGNEEKIYICHLKTFDL